MPVEPFTERASEDESELKDEIKTVRAKDSVLFELRCLKSVKNHPPNTVFRTCVRLLNILLFYPLSDDNRRTRKSRQNEFQCVGIACSQIHRQTHDEDCLALIPFQVVVKLCECLWKLGRDSNFE